MQGFFTKRKMRKLRSHPYLFFKDFINKHKFQPKKNGLQRIKLFGYSKYTIVVPCYNVALYIDAYFNSVIKQSLDFKENIKIICVDDGSTDDTANIILKWQKKYSKNITYMYQENAGAAAARNTGLLIAKTPFLTFNDSDDFLHKDYFQVVDNFIEKTNSQRLCMISTHLVYYIEEFKVFKDTHPLTFKFKKDAMMSVSDMGKNIQLACNSTFFRTKLLHNDKLVFDDLVKPTFEDAHFIARYLLHRQTQNIAFLKDAVYYYRKRADASSLVDTSWSNPKKFDELLRYGHQTILEQYAKTHSTIPKSIQHLVLYEYIWYLKYLLNNPERIVFLTKEEKNIFLKLLNDCFQYIDNNLILDFPLAGCWFYHKVGILNCIKDVKPPFQIVYIERYDPYKDEILLCYFCGEIDQEDVYIGYECVVPSHTKTTHDDFCGKTFVLQRRLWIPLNGKALESLNVFVNHVPTRLSLKGKQSHNGVSLRQIYKEFPEDKRECNEFTNAWILMDRNTQADDNAEHLYRYILEHHPEVNAYFVLNKSSHDWTRLKNEGFKLLAYGSRQHEKALRASSKIISSHIDGYVYNYFKDNSLNKKQLIFLQHGVTKDDLSRWLNAKYRIDLFITTNPAEYASIAGDGNRYKFTPKEVKLAGFARHDALLQKQNFKQPAEKQILIMPTWRNSLAGKAISGHQRELNPEFMQSEYAQAWQSFLCNEKLATLAQLYGYSVVFYPHASVQPYLDAFALPKWIKIVRHNQGSIQTVFHHASMMITDFSSVAFEMAYLKKPVCYYQFDETDFFAGKQVYQRGYFDYRRDGFGTVSIDEVSLLNSVEIILKNGGLAEDIYLERMENAFPFRDGKCCERIFDNICDLDIPSADLK